MYSMFQKHDPVSRPWYRLHELFHGAPEQHKVAGLSSTPELFWDLRNPRNDGGWNEILCLLLLLLHYETSAHCLVPERFSGFLEVYGDNQSVFICGWTVPLRKRSLCSCHDPPWGSDLRLQLLNTSDQNLNAALTASSPHILITREEAECPFSDVNNHFSPEGEKCTFRCLNILQKSSA